MSRIPVNFIFSPDWWNRRAGISFEEPFYLDLETRIANDVLMRRTLYELFRFGIADPQPRPIIGSRHIAGGFIIPSLLGVPLRFGANQAAWPVPLNLDREAVMRMRVVDPKHTWPMSLLLNQMDELEQRFGYVLGDLNTGGLINSAIEVRGNDLFTDLKEDPDLTDHLLGLIARTVAGVGRLVRQRTGTTSVAVNRSIVDVDSAIHVTSNCSVSMISPALYQDRVLPFERHLASHLSPFGVHHCGSNLQKYAAAYSTLQPRFIDVGFGSDLEQCNRLFPGAFLNLRLSPVRMLETRPDEVYSEVTQALTTCGRREQVGVCCINMDSGTPDGNVRAVLRAVDDFSIDRT